jgi:FlaA1/EpsC-like NDP-sugar epimerase
MPQLNLLKFYKTYLVIIYDLVIIFLSQVLAFILLNESIEAASLNILCQTSFLQLLILLFFGSYRGMWRYSSVKDLANLSTAVLISNTVLAIFFEYILPVEQYGHKVSFFIMNSFIMIVFLGAGRFSYRMIRELYFSRKDSLAKKSLIIIGAGNAGEQLAREIFKNQSLKYNIIGFVDDNPAKIGKTILGLPILGEINNLESLAKKHSVLDFFIAIPSATSEQTRRIVNVCTQNNYTFKILPKIDNILNAPVYSQLREVKAEDLLGRETIKLNLGSLSEMIQGKTILVSGGGGSIGSEICRQVLRFNPKTLIIFEITELFLFQIENELKETISHNTNIIPIIGDVKDKSKVNSVFEHMRPDVVFHAAAYKHVPLMEQNPSEAIRTNVMGTKILAEAALNSKVKKFILISSDKAVNPTNVMGATKRIAEIVCQNLNLKNDFTKFVTVRFGNVLGSNGSVIPTFKKQIEKGGPITITHPSITRYFMSIPEASQLVLEAASIGEGGEVFVLDMGNPVKIIDLAIDMIKLSGLTPHVDIEIKYIGLRPGEKLFEELFNQSEIVKDTIHSKIKKANLTKTTTAQHEIDNLINEASRLDEKSLRNNMKIIVPEFNHYQA